MSDFLKIFCEQIKDVLFFGAKLGLLSVRDMIFGKLF
jgi:hypothetical protein